jgi:hypothetical protein
MAQLSNAELFAVGAAVGGTVGLGLSLFVRYWVIPNLFVEAPTLNSLGTPSAPVGTPAAPVPQTQTGT